MGQLIVLRSAYCELRIAKTNLRKQSQSPGFNLEFYVCGVFLRKCGEQEGKLQWQ